MFVQPDTAASTAARSATVARTPSTPATAGIGGAPAAATSIDANAPWLTGYLDGTPARRGTSVLWLVLAGLVVGSGGLAVRRRLALP
jgi:hypothetical protein